MTGSHGAILPRQNTVCQSAGLLVVEADDPSTVKCLETASVVMKLQPSFPRTGLVPPDNLNVKSALTQGAEQAGGLWTGYGGCEGVRCVITRSEQTRSLLSTLVNT